MHDETPGGLAVKDRTLAYWTDPNNFPNYTPRQNVIRRHRREQQRTMLAGVFLASLIGFQL